ncbi:MAG: xylulokinase [Syntrophales bacterium]
MISKPECLLGVDLGTGGCKLTLIDMQGFILGSTFTEYKTNYPRHGWSEQNPEDWYQTFLVTIAKLFRDTGLKGSNIIALAVDASTHNVVLMGEKGEILRPCIMWTDQRSVDQVQDLEKRRGGEILQITYNKVNPTWTLPQLLWLRENESSVMDRVDRIFFTKDYLRNRLTGTWQTDYIDAQGSMLFDGGKRKWSEELIWELKLPLSAFPPIVSPTSLSGKITAEAARESGLLEGTPVVVGTSDTAAEDYGAGAIYPGQGILKMATAGNVCIMSEEPRPTPKGFNYPHVVDGMWYIMGATNSCASANRWTRDTLGQWEVEAAALQHKSAFQLMDEEAAKVPAGSEGLFFHPYLLGERSPYFDPYLRASFVGATMSHRKAHFYRAVLEGIAYSLLDSLRVISELGLSFKDIRIIGGGAKSPLWRRIVSDVMGMPVMVPKAGDASFGSALIAGVGIGLFPDARTAAEKCVQFEETITPDLGNHEKYGRYFAIYQKIHDQLAPVEKWIHETFVAGK